MTAIAAWVIDAVGEADLGDQRRRQRLLRTISTLAACPEWSVPQASADWPETLAIYRLWHNPHFHVPTLLRSIGAATGARCQGQSRVVLVQDTTGIAPSAPVRCQGLGPLGSGKTRGLKLHTTLVISAAGVPLGIGHQHLWTRDPDDPHRRQRRYHTPIEGKESRKWLLGVLQSVRHLPADSQPITVADREADIYEVQSLHQQLGGDFVVRAAQNRRLAQPEGNLFATLAQAPIRAQLSVAVPRADGRPERIASVTLRSCSLTLQPPDYASYAKARRTWWEQHPEVAPLLDTPLVPLTVGAVEVREEQPPAGVKPLHWRLLTSLPVESLTAAEQVVALYRLRWLVERFHYILKHGCRVEGLQLEAAERLERAVVTYSLVACHVLELTLQARQTPQVSCETMVPTLLWQTAYRVVHRTRDPPVEPPSLADFVGWVGRLGGHLGRTRDGPPGPKTLWRGLTELYRLADFWDLLQPDTTERTETV